MILGLSTTTLLSAGASLSACKKSRIEQTAQIARRFSLNGKVCHLRLGMCGSSDLRIV